MGKKLEKNIITVTVDSCFIEHLEGRLDDVIKRLQSVKEDYCKPSVHFSEPPWAKVQEQDRRSTIAACEWFSLDYSPSYYAEESASIELLGHRYETDEEFAARKNKRNTDNDKKRAAAKKKKIEDEVNEKELYKKLQKKYGNG